MIRRLIKLFILLISILGFASTIVHSQPNHNKDRRIIRQKIKGMSDEDKLLNFLVVKARYAHNYQHRLSGVCFDSESNYTSKYQSGAIKIFQFNRTDNVKGLPLPTLKTIKKSNASVPSWLPALVHADLLMDFDDSSSDALFYGLDSTNNYVRAIPYTHWSTIFSAMQTHDFIYYPGSPDDFLASIKKDKHWLQQSKKLDDKLFLKIVSAKGKKITTLPTEGIVYRWIKNVYQTSCQLSGMGEKIPITNLDMVNIASFSFIRHKFDTFLQHLNNYATVPSYSSLAPKAKTMQRLSAYDVVVIPLINPTPAQEEFIRALAVKTKVIIGLFNIDTIVIEPQNILKLLTIPQENNFTQSLAAEIIFGASNDTCLGRIRYSPPAVADMATDSLQKIDFLVEEAIQQKAIPGCQVLVAKNGQIVWNKAYGYLTYDSITPVTTHTLYDLASITKVLATTQGVMYLTEHNDLDIDKPLSNYLPYLRATNKKKITTRQVLAHQAGLYPYFPFWKKVKEEFNLSSSYKPGYSQVGKSLWASSQVADSILNWVAYSDLLADRIDTITHAQYIYSDVGFYLLKELIEQETGQPMDRLLSDVLYKPLGTKLMFNPICNYPAQEIAPTEIDFLLRQEKVQGYAHDRNTALMGGVSGPAGLFGSANDVAIILQLELNGGCYGGRKYFNPATIAQFLQRPYDNNRRALGWDKPGTEPDGPVSLLASDESFGHSGFTGGLIWADPKENLIFVFLSNRVYPSAENTKLIDMNIRTRIQDLVYQSILK